MRKISVLLLGWTFSLGLFAQLSLGDCQRLAEENYPLVKKYDLIRQTTEYTVKNIQLGYLPRIEVTGRATVQTEVPTFPGVLEGMLGNAGYQVKGLKKAQYQLGVNLYQKIWDGGHTRGEQRLAETKGRVEMRQNDVQRYALRERVNELYFGLLWLDEQIRLQSDFHTLLSANHQHLVDLEARGLAMQADVDALRAEDLKALQEMHSLETLRQGLREVLALFVGKEIKEVVKPQMDELLPTENCRPELRLFDAQKETLERQRDLLDYARFPQISLFAKGGYGYPGLDFFEAMFQHEWKWTAMLGVRLHWDISSFYTQKHRRRNLSLAELQIDNARETFLFHHQLKATQQQMEWRRYRAMLESDDEIVDLRQSVRRSAEQRLEKGIINVVQLLQEFTKEKEARTARSIHETEMLKHLYALKFTLNQ